MSAQMECRIACFRAMVLRTPRLFNKNGRQGPSSSRIPRDARRLCTAPGGGVQGLRFSLPESGLAVPSNDSRLGGVQE
ncbi:uncharacterized protein UV8b_07126 [Ustilaginoidea virens]|uniref:Uncharacterized protein n=1 Tax=Ustilaginoidea virens TaxID=1159556 RepID=A0A063BR07_USTVR|nr:uncharacterized protein UV8b_07126 [Ustilaginoidea virens]QUC22885.1 hypothetical protein UV8b_07126 [Ustilaginoidea virens]